MLCDDLERWDEYGVEGRLQRKETDAYSQLIHLVLQQKVTQPYKASIQFVFLSSKITADGDCSHEIKRHLLLRRKAMTKLDSILKSRDITLRTKVHV